MQIKPRLTKIKYDVNFLDADYLIKNIDVAFKVWKESPWYKDISFLTFVRPFFPIEPIKSPSIVGEKMPT